MSDLENAPFSLALYGAITHAPQAFGECSFASVVGRPSAPYRPLQPLEMEANGRHHNTLSLPQAKYYAYLSVYPLKKNGAGRTGNIHLNACNHSLHYVLGGSSLRFELFLDISPWRRSS